MTLKRHHPKCVLRNGYGMNRAFILLELAERCEAATGPGRDIDLEIIRVAHGAEVRGTANPRAFLNNKHFDIPYYTTSVDAALTLVPEGRGYIYKRHGIKSEVRAQIESGDRMTFVEGDAATLALAICAAALRARAAQ